MPLHPCRGVSSDGVDRSSVDPRARDWIPTRRGVKMSGGAASHFNYERDTLFDAPVLVHEMPEGAAGSRCQPKGV